MPELQIKQNNPGPPPRRIGVEQVLARMPAMIQISLILFPPIVAGGLVWSLVFNGGRSGYAMASITGVVLLLNLYWAWSHYRRLTLYPAILGSVKGYTNPDDFRTSHMTILQFRYEVNGVPYRGEQNVGTHPDIPIGEPIWVLYNPQRPRDAIPWLD
jgi:hypothetical protein